MKTLARAPLVHPSSFRLHPYSPGGLFSVALSGGLLRVVVNDHRALAVRTFLIPTEPERDRHCSRDSIIRVWIRECFSVEARIPKPEFQILALPAARVPNAQNDTGPHTFGHCVIRALIRNSGFGIRVYDPAFPLILQNSGSPRGPLAAVGVSRSSGLVCRSGARRVCPG